MASENACEQKTEPRYSIDAEEEDERFSQSSYWRAVIFLSDTHPEEKL